MRFLYFLISHSIFISCCAVGLCAETFLLLHLPVDFKVLGFVFFSTLCSYNFYWLLSKFYFGQRNYSFLKNNLSSIIMLFVGSVGTLYYFTISTLNIGIVFISFFLTLLYSLPLWPFSFSKKMQQVGFVKTILLAFTWAFVTIYFPLNKLFFVDNVNVFLFANRFLFMLMLCIIFDKRDVAIDKIRGLQSLATFVSTQKIQVLYALILIVYLLNSIFVFQNFPKVYFLQPIIMANFLFFAYRKSIQPQGYLFYYFFIDGLMLISFLLTLITQIKFI